MHICTLARCLLGCTRVASSQWRWQSGKSSASSQASDEESTAPTRNHRAVSGWQRHRQHTVGRVQPRASSIANSGRQTTVHCSTLAGSSFEREFDADSLCGVDSNRSIYAHNLSIAARVRRDATGETRQSKQTKRRKDALARGLAASLGGHSAPAVVARITRRTRLDARG
jgi:hypothetical protein